MKQKHLLSVILLNLICITTSFSQNIVNTGRGATHVILEEFTGVKCPSCPSGHVSMEQLYNSNPNLVHITSYNPENSSLTLPSTGYTNFRRTFANRFWKQSWGAAQSSGLSMPCAYMNRKTWTDGDMLLFNSEWSTHVDTFLMDTLAPLNLGLSSSYNSSSQTLTIDVELFHLDNITGNNYINILITEDGLTSNTQGGSNISPYSYSHTFRENVTLGQWGDLILGSQNQGTLYSKQYTFNLANAIDPINIDSAHIIAFVSNDSISRTIHNGISVNANGGSKSTGNPGPPINNNTLVNDNYISKNDVSIFPNPSNNEINIRLNSNLISQVESIDIFNLIGEKIESLEISNNSNLISINPDKLSTPGVYSIRINSKKGSILKIINRF